MLVGILMRKETKELSEAMAFFNSGEAEAPTTLSEKLMITRMNTTLVLGLGMW